MTHRVLAMALGVAFALSGAGCGRESAPTPTRTAPTTPQRTTPTPPSPPKTTPARRVSLSTERARPRSVPVTIRPSSTLRDPSEVCPTTSSRPRVVVAIVVSPWAPVLPGKPITPGDIVLVCATGFTAREPVAASMTTTTGPDQRYRWPTGDAAQRHPWAFAAIGNVGVGRHRLTLVQGSTKQQMDFDVSNFRPRVSTWTDALFGVRAGAAFVVGNGAVRPGSRAHFDVYARDAHGVYRYRTTVTGRADRRGVAFARVLTARSDAGSYLVRTREVPRKLEPPVSFTVLAPGKSVLQTHRSPPPGVPTQFAYFEEGDGIDCSGDPDGPPALDLGRIQPRELTHVSPETLDHVDIGDELVICALGFDTDRAVQLTITGPAGARSTSIPAQNESGSESAASGLGILSTQPVPTSTALGRYRVTVRQGNTTATARFAVRDATVPGFFFGPRTSSQQRVFVVGLQPRETVDMVLYRKTDKPALHASRPGGYKAELVSAERLTADRRGMATTSFWPNPGDDDCYLARIEVRKRLLRDPYGINTYCAQDHAIDRGAIVETSLFG